MHDFLFLLAHREQALPGHSSRLLVGLAMTASDRISHDDRKMRVYKRWRFAHFDNEELIQEEHSNHNYNT